MTTGPTHYELAEKWADRAEARYIAFASVGDDDAMQEGQLAAAIAQVHATLALAAATALSQTGEMFVPDADGWEIAASAHKRPAADPNPLSTVDGAE